MVMNSKAKEFYEVIENLVWKHDIDYMDAIIMHCEKNNIEVESIASLIKSNENIKSKIQIEAEKLNYLPKTARLDI
jgi:hypothetical protein